jgi:hypothetical protein
MGGACIAHEEIRKAYNILIGKPERKRTLGTLGADMWTILKWVLGN